MLTIYGSKQRFCDGISRRNFLKIGALGLGGLSLPQLLQAESLSGIRRSHKAIIMIFLPGGPSHQDIFDLKTEAPSEIRGEFKPISTKVPGIQICEHLPLRNQPPGGWPSLGSVVSKLQGPVNRSLPPFVGLSPKMGEMRWARSGDP